MAIIEVPDISIVKTVNGSKQLLSLRDQKIKKDGVLNTFGVGSGIKCNGDLYVLEREEKEPIIIPEDEVNIVIQFVTKEPNLSFYTKSGFDFDYIDWGDGNIDVNVPQSGIKHSYVDNKDTHDVKCYWNNNKTLDRTLSEVNLSSMGLTSFKIFTNAGKLTLYNNEFTSFSTNKLTDLKTLYIYGNQKLTLLDITDYALSINSIRCHDCNLNSLVFKRNHTSLREIWCYGNPLVTSQDALTKLANSLPNNTGGTAGVLYIKNSISAAWIQDICASKNWTIV